MTIFTSRATFIVVMALCAVLHAVAVPARTADDTLLDAPDLGLLDSGVIHAMVHLADGSLVIGGGFSRVQGHAVRNLAKILPDGGLDTSWTPNPDGVVRALALDAAGTLYVGGDFQAIQGETRLSFARFKPEALGAVDPDWPAAGTNLYRPHRMAVSADRSMIYVASQTSLLMRISAAGVVDTQWQPLSGGPLRDMVLDAAGRLYVGGKNLRAPAGAGTRPLWRIDTHGSGDVDASWNPQAIGEVHALAVDPATDSLFIGGTGLTQGAPTGRDGLARIAVGSGGAIDPGWTPGIDRSVAALRLMDGTLRVAIREALDDDGTMHPGEVLQVDPHSGLVDTASRKAVVGSVTAMAGGDGHALALGGLFTRIGDTDSFNLFQAPVDPTVPARAMEVGRAGLVTDMIRLADGSMIVAGYFQWAAGVPRAHLLKLRPDLTVDPVWNPAPDEAVDVIETDHRGGIYISGSFLRIAGRPARRLARISSEGEGLLDTGWAPALIHPQFSGGYIEALLFDGQQHLFVKGRFNALPDVDDRPIVKIAVDGAGAGQIVPEWKPALRRGYGRSLALDSQRRLYSVVGLGVERMATSGSGDVDSLWKIDVVGTGIVDLAIDRQDRLYLAGYFDTVAGQPRANVARVRTDGNPEVDPTWQVATDGAVTVMALDDGGRLYLAGDFTSVSAVPAAGLARLAQDTGVVDTGWMATLTTSINWSRVSAIVVDSAARVFVGGAFDGVNGVRRSGFAVFGDAIFTDGIEPGPDAD